MKKSSHKEMVPEAQQTVISQNNNNLVINVGKHSNIINQTCYPANHSETPEGHAFVLDLQHIL